MPPWLGLLLVAAMSAAFLLALRLVYVLNRHSAEAYGYEPFSLPNAALMLVVSLLLLSALSDPRAGAAVAVKLGVAGVLSMGMLLLIAWRTRVWIAACAVALMAVGALAILPSLVFRYFAVADGGPRRDG
jgi:hypothetical protein